MKNSFKPLWTILNISDNLHSNFFFICSGFVESSLRISKSPRREITMERKVLEYLYEEWYTRKLFLKEPT